MGNVRDTPCGHRCALRASQRLRANERAGLVLHAPDVRLRHGPDVRGQRVQDIALPWIEFERHRRRLNDLRTDVQRRRGREVEPVVADFPPAANDAARRKIQKRARPLDLDLLAAGQPELSADETVLEDDRQLLERRVDERGVREGQVHADYLTRRCIDVQGTDDSWKPVILWSHLDFAHADAL